MSLVIAVANQKGGSGKTTIALNLAGAYCDDDPSLKVLVIDADLQSSSMRATSAGTEPYPFTVVNLAAAGSNLGREIKRLADNYDLIIVDCPPSVHDKNTEVAISASDFVLVPMDASALDAWSTVGMLQLIRRKVGSDATACGVVFNKVNKKTTGYGEVRAAMEEDNPYPILESTIAQREIYKIAIGVGATVFTVKGQRSTKIAKQEILAVAKEILTIKGLMEA
ncbi:ParA family protein [Caballeronia cordobensis]|uniref:ParA family protein n=1 Tax=Caballeronia cordobensis TaxID=1353886 RepID=UPI00045F0417|nr:cobyrinic acid ac-diamide synthase [Burkholderia sp. RPE67]